MKTLPAFKVVYEDGSSYVTSMATDITEADARAYFMGRTFEQDDERTHKKVVDVRQIRSYTGSPNYWHIARNGRQIDIHVSDYAEKRELTVCADLRSEDDAHLIAAAPRMRAALQLAYDNSCARSETNRKWTTKDQAAHESMKLALDYADGLCGVTIRKVA